MSGERYRLRLVDGTFAVARLPGDAAWPAWADGLPFASVTRSRHETSVVCAEARVPPGTPTVERDYALLMLEGPLAFEAVGVLASITVPLAAARVPILAISTFDTDYVLVKQAMLERAVAALIAAGHSVEEA